MRFVKKILLVALFTMSLVSLPTLVSADTSDEAHLFTSEQIQELNQLASKIEEKSKAKVYVATTKENNGTEKEFATEFLRNKVGNNKNGIVYLIDMSQRGYQITTSGNMIDFITDKRIKRINTISQDKLSDGDYFGAAKNYLVMTDEFVEKGVPGGHYRIDSETGEITRYKVLTPFEIVLSLIIALVISLTFFFVIKAKYQLKMKNQAYPFRDKSSVNLTVQTDTVVRSWVTTRVIPKNNDNNDSGFGDGGSTTYSSGGGTFGGGGGKF